LAASVRFTIHPAIPEDVSAIFALIQALAAYEHLCHAVTGTPAALAEHLFGNRPHAEALLAKIDDQAVGFALFFPSYSTFLTQPGLYLEDLFVLSDYRGKGIGKALLAQVAHLAVARGCGRLEWSVLDWNAPAIAFYERMGATLLEDWRTCRVMGQELTQLAASLS
jgi:GNAT superfamily N-acetyltransferase